MELMNIHEAIQSRHSVRSYFSTPIDEEALSVLKQAVKDATLESCIRIQLITDEPEAFSGFMAHYGHFCGVRNYIAFVGEKDATLETRVGYYGEKLVLLAQQLGLNTCWVALTYQKKKCPVIVNPGEKLVCVISLGYGVTQGKPHNSRPIAQVCNLSESSPEWFRSGMDAVMLAPTAVNQQRFYFEQDGNTVKVRSTGGPCSDIDLGIVKYHFELGAGTENFVWAE